MVVVFSTRDYFPYLFTNSEAVAKETTRLAILLGFTVLLNSLQPVLSGNTNTMYYSWTPIRLKLVFLKKYKSQNESFLHVYFVFNLFVKGLLLELGGKQ